MVTRLSSPGRFFVRAATTFVVAIGLIGSLAACSTPPGSDGSGDCKVTASGSVSDSVAVSGAFGEKPTVSFESPVTVNETQRTVVTLGDGSVANEGSEVTVEFTILSGATGEEIDATGYDGTAPAVWTLDDTLIAGLTKTLLCSPAGSRVVGAISSADGLSSEALSQLGLAADDLLVVVADVIAAEEPVAAVAPLPKADGVEQPATDGFPVVELDDSGRPTITIPDLAPPVDLQLAVLKEGEGEVVPDGADVVVHYVGVNWNTKKIFDESWARGEPSTFNTKAVIAGFTAALEGQTVGSQVIVIIPPDDGYGAAGRAPDIGGTDTLVFVVDILGLA